MDRKWFLVITVILVVALMIGFLVGLSPAKRDSQVPDTIEKGQRLLSRQEQIELMMECWKDADQVMRGTGIFSGYGEDRISATNYLVRTFFEYRTR